MESRIIIYRTLAFLLMFAGWAGISYGQYHTSVAYPFNESRQADSTEMFAESYPITSRTISESYDRTREKLDVFFPNPVTSKSQLHYYAIEDSKTKFFLFNEYGSIVIYREGHCLKGVNDITISRQGLLEGPHYYILWIAKENRTIKGQLTVM